MSTYSLNETTNLAQCEALLKKARLQHKNLLSKVMGMEVQVERFLDTRAMLRTKIAEYSSALGAVSNALVALPPDSAAYRKEERLQHRLEYQLFNMEQRLEKYPPEKLIEKEIRLQTLQGSLEAQSTAVAELEAHCILLLAPLTQPVVTKAGAKATIIHPPAKVMSEGEMPAATDAPPIIYKINGGRVNGHRATKQTGSLSDA